MPQLDKKPLSWFKTNPQVRKEYDDAELRTLGASLKVAQLQPVLAKPDGTLLVGERRLRAAKLVGLQSLDVIITEKPLTDSEIRVIQLTENIHRVDLTPAELSDACQELLRLNLGWTAKDLAAHLKKSEPSISRYLAIFKTIPAVQEAYRAGSIGPSDAAALAQVDAAEQHRLLAIRLHGGTRDQIEAETRKTRNGSHQTVKVARIRCALPSGVTLTFAGEEISLEDSIQAAQDWLKEAKRALDQGLDARVFAKVLAQKAKVQT